MADLSDWRMGQYAAGLRGMPIGQKQTHPTTSKESIADRRFSIVQVEGGATNRIPGTLLVVCDNGPDTYWVWASKRVTGIRRDVCKTIASDLSLDDALKRLGRKPRTKHDNASTASSLKKSSPS
jgi:hypothetical protein